MTHVGQGVGVKAAGPPKAAAALTLRQISAALKGYRDVEVKAASIQQALRTPQLGQPEAVAGAYAATVRSLVAVLATLTTEITKPGERSEGIFWPAPGR